MYETRKITKNGLGNEGRVKRDHSTLDPCSRGVICSSLNESLDITEGLDGGPMALEDLETRAIFSGSWEALVIIFRDLGSGDLGSPEES